MKSTRKHPWITPLTSPLIGSCIVMIVTGMLSRAVHAQCPPIPTTHTNGAIEGQVAGGLATQAAIATQGEGKFIVIFAKPIPAPSLNGIWVHRLKAGVICIFETRDPGTDTDDDVSPALLTIDLGAGRGVHEFPSIAMNRGADGRAEWFASRGFRT